jgi:hypothetical protein
MSVDVRVGGSPNAALVSRGFLHVRRTSGCAQRPYGEQSARVNPQFSFSLMSQAGEEFPFFPRFPRYVSLLRFARACRVAKKKGKAYPTASRSSSSSWADSRTGECWDGGAGVVVLGEVDAHHLISALSPTHRHPPGEST